MSAAQENQPDLGRLPSSGAASVALRRSSDQPWSTPKSVQWAVILMVVGIAFTALDIITEYSELSGNRGQLELAGDGRFDALASLFIVGGLIKAGLWLWMALVCRQGRNWGRIVSTIFFGTGCLAFGVGCLAVLSTTAVTTSPGSQALNAVPVLIGLIVVIMLWSEQSGPYFQAAPIPSRQEPAS